jgi:enamine deaminase RidA (YjgF/YER057c/UK114 family)
MTTAQEPRLVGVTSPDFVSPSDLPTPFGYSHVVGIPAGRLLWTSGQVAVDVSGQVPDGWEAQTRLVFENVGRALSAQGGGWSDVVKLTYFVTGVEEITTVRSVRDEFVDTERPPTSSLVQVAGLFRPDLLIEVEAVAWLP